MPQRRLLAVDDDPRYLRLMRVNLEAAGYDFVGARTADEALALLAASPVDAILLDVHMPDMDGFALLEHIREFSDAPAIFVSAYGEEANVVRGLRLGADDYLKKPFGTAELLARVEAVLRRCAVGQAPSSLSVGELHVDLAQHRVFRAGREVVLSRTEFRLLAYLARHAGKVVPQETLVRGVWGRNYDEGYEGLRVYVYRLRQKLERDPNAPAFLVTFPGVGYVLKAPAPDTESATLAS